jgi:hypothetical protein
MRSAAPQRTLALLAAGLALAAATVAWFVPFLTREREAISSVPAPSPVAAVEGIELRPGDRACVDQVTFDDDSQVVELTALTRRRSGPPLAVTAAAGDYRAQATVAGGYAQPALLRPELDPPRGSSVGTLCVRNTGAAPVSFLATSDARTSSLRSTTRVDGEAVPQDLTVRLLAADGGSVIDRAGELVDRAAAFKPRLLGAAFVWTVLLLVAGGVAAGGLYALAASYRESG